MVDDPLKGRIIRIGTRGSPLALAQVDEVCRRLVTFSPALAAPGRLVTVPIMTTGDQIQDRTLVEVGGKGLFTKEIEEGLLDRQLDIAVHSMKDMPSVLPDGLIIGAILPREDVRDVLISCDGHDLVNLPDGAVIGTSSLRRQSLIRAMRPDCRVVPLRGNVGTRLYKLEQGVIDATILAAAGLNRLWRTDMMHQSRFLDPEIMVPAVAQGAIGVEIHQDDVTLRQLLSSISCQFSTAEIEAERAFLAVLDGSCRTPIGGLARWHGEELRLNTVMAHPNGQQIFRFCAQIAIKPAEMMQDARNFGQDVAKNLRDQLPTGFMESIYVTTQKAI